MCDSVSTAQEATHVVREGGKEALMRCSGRINGAPSDEYFTYMLNPRYALMIAWIGEVCFSPLS
jgi:hypothetical protein